jgi:hypothetical protein
MNTFTANPRGTMAAKTIPSTNGANGTGVDELLFQNDTVSLCLLVNRRHGNMRVIDFRAGPTMAKRNFILAAAKREGVEKVYTLVERDEIGTWARLGFSREGSIPGFYRRSDAWIMGAVVSQVGPFRGDSLHDDDDDDDHEARDGSPAAALADKTVVRAKKLLKDGGELLVPGVRITRASEVETRKAVSASTKLGRALTGFEPFGRDAARLYWSCTASPLSPKASGARSATKAARTVSKTKPAKPGPYVTYAAREVQECFGNSMFEVLEAPRSDGDRLAVTSVVASICDALREERCASTFTLAPSDDVHFAAALLANGFRRSGLLQRHVVVGGERKDAVIWSRKLAD